MKSYQSMTKEELQQEYEVILARYNDFKSKNLALDMSRGKPGADQLDLSMPMLDILKSTDVLKAENGFDTRNYGILDGLPEAKKLFAEILEVSPNNIFVGGNSSLNLMFDCVSRSMVFGVLGGTPWSKLGKVKFIAPVPGYDRHFAICELFGIEMINVPINEQGPDMDIIERLVAEDESIKGVWSVPMYSNPTGITYSDDVVRRFANLKPKAKDFRIYWDNAYCVHHIRDDADKILNIFEEASKCGNEDMVYEFASTSKITFSGGGVAVMVASENNLKDIRSKVTIQTIGFDKVNQLRHARYFKNLDGIKAHMKKHQAILEPKFDIVLSILEKNIAPYGIAEYTKPKGGYFISFNTIKGCAKRVGELCKEAGVVLTPVGATFPYRIDADNQNIRIAPTFPPVEELKIAMELFCDCVKLASIEHFIND